MIQENYNTKYQISNKIEKVCKDFIPHFNDINFNQKVTPQTYCNYETTQKILYDMKVYDKKIKETYIKNL